MIPRFVGAVDGPLAAAARLATDARLAVRVVIPEPDEDCRFLIELAADQAGVDSVIKASAGGATVHFIARHQDRPMTANTEHPTARMRWTVRSERPDQNPPAPPIVDFVAFQHASAALALDTTDDMEDEQIWRQLLQARPRAHMCAGIPTLVLNDVGGVVGLLRRRAARRGALVRVNPDVCDCV